MEPHDAVSLLTMLSGVSYSEIENEVAQVLGLPAFCLSKRRHLCPTGSAEQSDFKFWLERLSGEAEQGPARYHGDHPC